MAEKRTARQVGRTKPEKLGAPSHLSSWEQRFKELESFKKEHGHCNVPCEYQSNPKLGRWLSDADLAAIAGLLFSVRGQRGSVRDAGLLELDEPDERLHRVADNLLHHFGPGLGLEVPEGDLGVGDDLGQERQELAVPATVGRGGSWGCTNHFLR